MIAGSADGVADIARLVSSIHKPITFDRRIPDTDHDALDLPPTDMLPVGIPAPPGPAAHKRKPAIRSSGAAAPHGSSE